MSRSRGKFWPFSVWASWRGLISIKISIYARALHRRAALNERVDRRRGPIVTMYYPLSYDVSAPARNSRSSVANKNTQVLQPGPGRLASRGSRHVAIRTAQFAAKSSRAGIWDEVVGVHSSKSYQCGPSCQELVHSYASAPRRLRCMSSLICGSGSTW